jgi:hypothetical protein
MSRNHPVNAAASHRQKLLNLAKARGQVFEEVLRQFALERFLSRIARSELQTKLILKGAQMLRVWDPAIQRPTMDVDFLARMSNDPRHIEVWVRELCETIEADEEDGLQFDPESIQTRIIKEDADYQGVRVLLWATLEKARVRIQVDLGFDDVVSPQPEAVLFPTLLHHQSPQLQGYTRESTIAEKLHAMVVLELLNSRMKDFYDVYLLSRTQGFHSDTLRTALERTFAHRQTNIPENLPMLLREENPVAEQKQIQWTAFLRKNRIVDCPVSFAELAKELRHFVEPILIAETHEKLHEWFPMSGWNES